MKKLNFVRNGFRVFFVSSLACQVLSGCASEVPETESIVDAQTMQAARLSFETTSDSPIQRGNNAFQLVLRDKDTEQPIRDATVYVSVTMPSMGHTSPAIPVVVSKGEGVYTVLDVVFAMGGTWDVSYQVNYAGGQDTISFEYAVPLERSGD